MKNKISIFVVFPLLCIQARNVSAQDDSTYQGIQFEQGLNWPEILTKAKAEGKYVFVDCYATWCGPCKMMDKNVYTSKMVGDSMNSRFISIKVQLDSTGKDNGYLKSWYRDAHHFRQLYKIAALPTFLFFSPEGKIVHRSFGYKNDSDFIVLASKATNPDKQYYTLLEEYLRGGNNYMTMPYLASFSNALGDQELARRITQDYITHYLWTLRETELFTSKNINFVASFTQSTKDAGFKLFHDHPKEIDKVMWPNYSEDMINALITKEEIEPLLWKDDKPRVNKPDWDKIASRLKREYNGYYARLVVFDAQIRWYGYHKTWSSYCKTIIKRVDQYGPFGPVIDVYFRYNIAAFELFLHSDNKKELSMALAWSDSSLNTRDTNEQYFDTYANLLYKLGRKDEALHWEEKAIAFDVELAKKAGAPKGYFFDEFTSTLDKIKQGVPTW